MEFTISLFFLLLFSWTLGGSAVCSVTGLPIYLPTYMPRHLQSYALQIVKPSRILDGINSCIVRYVVFKTILYLLLPARYC